MQKHRVSNQCQYRGAHTYPGPGAGTTGVTTAAAGGGGGGGPTAIPKSTCAAKMNKGTTRSTAIINLLVFIKTPHGSKCTPCANHPFALDSSEGVLQSSRGTIRCPAIAFACFDAKPTRLAA